MSKSEESKSDWSSCEKLMTSSLQEVHARRKAITTIVESFILIILLYDLNSHFIFADLDSALHNKMISSKFIRPLSTNYHDFTEKEIVEADDEVPLKFRQPPHPQTYVKKPIKAKPSEPSEISYHPPPPRPQSPSCLDCCQACCEPELCPDCLEKLCQKCKSSLCLKFSICSDCHADLCPKCSKIFSKAKELKLRNYSIQLKRQNEFHFENCECNRCKVDRSKLLEKKSEKLMQSGQSREQGQGSEEG